MCLPSIKRLLFHKLSVNLLNQCFQTAPESWQAGTAMLPQTDTAEFTRRHQWFRICHRLFTNFLFQSFLTTSWQNCLISEGSLVMLPLLKWFTGWISWNWHCVHKHLLLTRTQTLHTVATTESLVRFWQVYVISHHTGRIQETLTSDSNTSWANHPLSLTRKRSSWSLKKNSRRFSLSRQHETFRYYSLHQY